MRKVTYLFPIPMYLTIIKLQYRSKVTQLFFGVIYRVSQSSSFNIKIVRFKLVLLRKKRGIFEEYMIRYKDVIGKRVNPFDNKNVAKRAIIAFYFLGALRRKDHCCERY